MVRLSVVIPNYNHAHFLPECLDSILAQSFKPTEILVIDDASSDESLEVIFRYQKLHPVIHLVKNDRNRGVIFSVNRALQLVSGEYVVLCAADDLFLPNFFSLGMDYLKRHPDLGFCCGDAFRFFDKKPYQLEKIDLGLKKSSRVILPQEIEKILWKKPFWVPSHSTIYRTDLVRKYGGFDPKLKNLCDWFLNYQIAFNHPVGYIPEPFAAVRIVEQSYGIAIKRNKKERETAFTHLLQMILNSKEKALFLRSGILGQVGIAMVSFLAKRPIYWKFFPFAFKKKVQYWLNARFLRRRLRE